MKTEMKIETKEIRAWLKEEQEEEYGRFQRKLIPTLQEETILGVRIPKLRNYAKELRKKNVEGFLKDLPHQYFEENLLHIFLICQEKEYEEVLQKLEVFLPFLDNWESCDLCTPLIFKTHRKDLIQKIPKWIQDTQPYIQRFGIKMLMDHYLEEEFREEYLRWVSEMDSKEYYVNMMRAWFLATALVKQYERVLPVLESKTLDVWTHNKSIQKGIESRRLSLEQKQYLISLRRRRIL